jgi:hypothetical protein
LLNIYIFSDAVAAAAADKSSATAAEEICEGEEPLFLHRKGAAPSDNSAVVVSI